MIPNLTIASSSRDISQIDPPIITREALQSRLRSWARDPSTHVSRSDGTQIAKKIITFYMIETDSKFTSRRTGSLEITGVQTNSFPDIFSYPPFTRITNLNLQMGLSELPGSIYQLSTLKSLHLSNNNLDHLSDNLSALSQLVDVNLSHNQLRQLPENLHQLHHLQKLDLSFNKLAEIPNNLDRLQSLTDLNLACNNLVDLPESMAQCKSLTHLDLSSNNFSSLPKCLPQISQIKDLNLRENNLTFLPDVSQWKELARLDLGNNKFTEWPKSLEEISNHAIVIIDANFSAWKTAKLLSKIERPNYRGPQVITGLEVIDSSDSEDEFTQDSMSALPVTMNDRIEFPGNSSSSERVRKRKAEKFLEQSEISRKVLKRNPPSIISDDHGSSYTVFGESKDKPIGVYKPRLQVMRADIDYESDDDQVPGIPIGTEAFRERLAYALNYELSQLLDQNHIPLMDFGVPPTRIVDFQHKLFGKYHRTGSLQKFKKNCIELQPSTREKFEQIDRNELFKTAILDLIFLNKDRNSGNLLYSERKNTINLIDHGYCFPEIKGLETLQLDWKDLSFIHEPIPKNWIDFILQIDPHTMVDRTIKEIDLHKKNFPKEDMEISGEALFVMIYAIASLKQFAMTNQSPSIGRYLDHIVPKSHFHYVEIKDTSSNAAHFIELSDELPMGYLSSYPNSSGWIPKKFHPDSFDNMGVHGLFSREDGLFFPGENALQQICARHGFENVTLHKKEFMESEFLKQIKEAFGAYQQDKQPITPHLIHQNLDETLSYITSFLAKHPIRSFEDRMIDELR